jgi:hypothetical protein
MPRGVKGSGPYSKVNKGTKGARGKRADESLLDDDDAPATRPPDDGRARCRIDGTVMENGTCPSCRRRAQRFARINQLEAELASLKVKHCGICEAPGARGSKHHPAPVCPTCRKMLGTEARLSRKLAKAKTRKST